MAYRAPVADMLFTMTHAAGLARGIESGLYHDLADGALEALLEEAAKFAENRLAPLNRVGDQSGAKLEGDRVTTAPGWRDAYAQWVEGGWNSVLGVPEFGGMGLPTLANAAFTEMWNAANMAFALCPLLGFGAIDAVEIHGSEDLKQRYLAKMISGEWSATMNLTEPQAGSDLSALRTRAEKQADGSYKITGQKIYITYGEHDMTDNIVHLVLARLSDAPAGTKGISLFLVPKFLPDGSRNDLRCTGIEHKLGINASPTCSMSYGDNGGAIGWLIGEENRGLNCMFTMMNSARLSVGLQGVAQGELATQAALAYARERRQGRGSGSGAVPIIEHPDIRRTIATMRALTDASRTICYMTAGALDQSHRLEDEAGAKAAADRAALLTPVAKAFSTDIGNEVASMGVQVHGGMGFVEETGAAQIMRDVRIAGIYEGTNGIQSIDLVQRKLPLGGGAVVRAEIDSMRKSVEQVRATNAPAFGRMGGALGESVEALSRATDFMLDALGRAPQDALAGATPYLRLFGIARGGTALADLALAAHRLSSVDANPSHDARIATARFFAEHIATASSGLEASIVDGAASVNDPTLIAAE